MKRVIFILFFILLLDSCKDEEPLPTYTFKGQFINATENTVPVGLKVTLEASSGPNALNFQTQILGSAVTDSMGRFAITYTKTKLPVLRLLSQFYTYTGLPINQNVDTIFYKSSKGTLVFVFTANYPLKNTDTLYLGLPPFEQGQNVSIVKLPGPFSTKEIVKYRTLKEEGGIQYFWAIGRTQWDSATFFSHKYPKNRLDIFMRGDPFIDTIRIKYR